MSTIFNDDPARRGLPRPLSWGLLSSLLILLIVFAARSDRAHWPSLVGDEAAYLMGAESLAWDFDFRYNTADLSRFVNRRGAPDGLILQSPDQGATLYYGKPLVYPLAIAPFVRFAPERGFAIGNAVYLALGCLLAAWALTPLLGGNAPFFIAVFVFASLTFAHVFWAHSDLFQMSLVAIGLSLILRSRFAEGGGGRVRLGGHLAPKNPWRSGPAVLPVVGTAMLALVVLTRPFYLPILLIPFVAATSRRRRVTAVVTALLTLLIFVGWNRIERDTWSSYSGDRRSAYGYNGFPTVGTADAEAPQTDLPTQESTDWWNQTAKRTGGDSWVRNGLFPFPFQLRQSLWNIDYLFAGRHVGLVPYFLPFVLGLIAFRSDRVTWSTILAICTVLGLFLLARPFNFWGGGGSLGNRYFLPIYPLFWFLIRRPISWGWAAAAAVLAAPFLWPTWSDPDQFWRKPSGAYAHVSRAAERWLPYETTQNQLKPSNREDFHLAVSSGDPLWTKPLSPRVTSADGGRTMRVHPGEGTTEILVATETPQRSFRIEVEGEPPRVARFRGPTARHRMWWSFDPLYLYRFEILEADARDDLSEDRRVRIAPLARSAD